MPLLLSKSISDHSAYAVWNIQETNEALAEMLAEQAPQHMHTVKAAEWMVGRILIRHLCNQYDIPYEGMENLETGKPILRNKKAEISISHSFPMAAAMISLKDPCGIDLERPRHKMIQVRDKFVNGSEVRYGDDLRKLCAIWCAKEVLYKIYSRKKLSLKDDTYIKFLSDFDLTGTINKPNNGSPKNYKISVEEVKDYLLAYNS
ncbi:MAG: 4'-phosphopantetheinyl transferase superfamily protein [Cyclobacteriaceae bacterium]